MRKHGWEEMSQGSRRAWAGEKSLGWGGEEPYKEKKDLTRRRQAWERRWA